METDKRGLGRVTTALFEVDVKIPPTLDTDAVVPKLEARLVLERLLLSMRISTDGNMVPMSEAIPATEEAQYVGTELVAEHSLKIVLSTMTIKKSANQALVEASLKDAPPMTVCTLRPAESENEALTLVSVVALLFATRQLIEAT